MSDNRERLAAFRVREALRLAESHAVEIRKLLNKHKSAKGGGVMDNAVALIESIERLARLGQVSAAEDAVEIAYRIE
jgi:hypothetical protein